MSDFSELYEAFIDKDAEKIEQTLTRLEQEEDPNKLQRFKDLYDFHKQNFFIALGQCGLSHQQKDNIFARISKILSPKPTVVQSLKRTAETDISDRPSKKMRLEDQSDNFILSPNIECLLSLRYTQAQIELLNGQADSSKIIDALVELHRSNLLLMNKEKLYSLAVAGKLDSLNAYRKYAIKLTQLNFTSKQIFRLINGARALTRIELMIENWDALQEHKLQVKDLVTLFSGSVGPDGIKNVINYLPRLREKNCPLSFVRSVTQKTTGNILKTIFDNYSLLEHHECWKEIEHILLNTGLKELEFYIQALNSKLSPIDLEFNTKTTTVTHMNKSSFFLQQEKPADIYQSSDSMSIKNLLN